MSIPIATSPGRSGFGPQLSLSYDSGSGNGVFGFGWQLALPSISRKTDKGIPRYTDSDVFMLGGVEDLVPMLVRDSAGDWVEESLPPRPFEGRDYDIRRYRPRIEGSFVRFERWTRKDDGDIHWRTISPDNVTTLYGKTPDSRVADPAARHRIFSWLISEQFDDRGNAMTFEYVEESDANVDLTRIGEQHRQRTANRYLKRIWYGNRISRLVEPDLTAARWLFEVVFDYDEGHCQPVEPVEGIPFEEQHRIIRASASAGQEWRSRPDAFSSYRSGFEVRTHRRCHRVLMFHHFDELGTGSYLVRSTAFDYEDFDYSRPFDVIDEMAHQGSTRIASFIRRVTQSGYVRESAGGTSAGESAVFSYRERSLPPLEFEYSKATIDPTIRDIDADSLAQIPGGLASPAHHWVDLDGEGVAGILVDSGQAWHYKPGLGDGRLGALQVVNRKHSMADLAGARQSLIDLAGDGQLDLVLLEPPVAGFIERSLDSSWEPFKTFPSAPNLAWDDPNLRFVDLTGDGHADVLITDRDAFTWHVSLAEEGFGPEERVALPGGEECGPRLVLADGVQSIYLADMSGDGLSDLVRVRNGEICYWPNRGYGRFGSKITMDHAPWLDENDRFSQRHVRLADVDGSGVTDLIYLAGDGARLYLNQAGNAWSGPIHLRGFPPVDHLASVDAIDLLGNGTACLVWSSLLPADAGRAMRYIDLMGGQKPHLLIRAVNNLGAETRVEYRASTHFYLEDKRSDAPWITKLPFPVHVVARIETYDFIARNRFSTAYKYHHGYFDGIEREFRGFGLVEQWDTEQIGSLRGGNEFPPAENDAASTHLPPVYTRSWYHTGVYLGRHHVSDYFAGLLDAEDPGEYYREPAWTGDREAGSHLLPDTVLPSGLTLDEEREACRALRGTLLRQEVYALDGKGTVAYPHGHPYVVTEQNVAVRRLQPRVGNRHSVFVTHPSESIAFHYERNPADPRIAHELTIEVDDFGNVLKSASIGYGRRSPDPDLGDADREQQARTLIVYTENHLTNAVLQDEDAYRTPLPAETSVFELTGLDPTGPAGRYRVPDIVDDAGSVRGAAIGYHEAPGTGACRRLIERTRVLYRPNDFGASRDDPDALLELETIESLALPGETYTLAFTDDLLLTVYRRSGHALLPAPEDVLGGQSGSRGGYVRGDELKTTGRFPATDATAADLDWWRPSGRIFFSEDAGDSAVGEAGVAAQSFFLPRRFRDPFGQNALVRYDRYHLLLRETEDPLRNRVSVIEQDYRVLQPAAISDANRNRSQAAFDAFGLVAGTANLSEGDSLELFDADLVQARVDAFYGADDPHGEAADLLRHATTRTISDPHRFYRTRMAAPDDSASWQPVFTAGLARETHRPDHPDGVAPKIQLGFSFSDGLGRVVQQKVQAEPRPANSPRWVGSGWTVYNNKGLPVRQFEPFFSQLPDRRHHYEFGVAVGVSPIAFYDPLGRAIATLHPNHTYEKVVFDPWRQQVYDVNDTVAPGDGPGASIGDPRTDADIGGVVETYAATLKDSWKTWYQQRTANGANAQEKLAAERAGKHAGTPTVIYVDALGRPFLTVAHDGFTEEGSPVLYSSRVELDIEGNQRVVRDAVVQAGDPLGRIAMCYDYDLLGNRIRQASMEAGERWMLNDVLGNPIRAWDSRGHSFRVDYDALRRPVRSFVVGADPSDAGNEILAERLVYGEQHPEAETRNLRGVLFLHLDQAGAATSEEFDAKGNLLHATRRLARDYRSAIDWSAVDADQTALPPDPSIAIDPAALAAALQSRLDAQIFSSRSEFNALSRPHRVISPDGSIIRPTYNEANLLERVDVNLRGKKRGGAPVWTTFVSNIDYNARGQRVRIRYGNGVTTKYTYDEETFRLTRLVTRRRPSRFPEDCPKPASTEWPGCDLQNLTYTYDPVGNITHIRDDAQQTVYFRNKRIEPGASYTYDPLYRLISATGREHLGQAGGNPIPHAHDDALRVGLPHPGDGTALGRYYETYEYDPVGNIRSMQHRLSDSNSSVWTRAFHYDEVSLIEGDASSGGPKTSNRLSRSILRINNTDQIERYLHDAHGNMSRMPHLGKQAAPDVPNMQWDFNDQLRRVDLDGAGTAYYVYDAGGQRIHKIWEKMPGLTEERIYLGGFEIHRQRNGNGSITLERETLHIMDDAQRIALVETRTAGTDIYLRRLIRYQFGNHLGSSCLELDHKAAVISYEEYSPYGSTVFQAVRSSTECPKRYRYTGKERDEDTGFSYHGARYYAPWLARWTSSDPGELVDGPNQYMFTLGNPVSSIDVGGEETPGHVRAPLPPWLQQEIASGNASAMFASPEPPSEVRQWDDRVNTKRPLHDAPTAGQRRAMESFRDRTRLRDQARIDSTTRAWAKAFQKAHDFEENKLGASLLAQLAYDFSELSGGNDIARGWTGESEHGDQYTSIERYMLVGSGVLAAASWAPTPAGGISRAGRIQRTSAALAKAEQGAAAASASLAATSRAGRGGGLTTSQERFAEYIMEHGYYAQAMASSEGLPTSNGVAGTVAHTYLEIFVKEINKELRLGTFELDLGGRFGALPEVFVNGAGEIVGRREAGSVGMDVLLFENGALFAALDLKTGKLWSRAEVRERQRAFGLDPIQFGLDAWQTR